MNSHLIWFLLRVFIIRDNISIVIYVVSHHFIRFDSLDDRLNVMFLFKYLRRMVQVIRYESFDIKGCLFWRGGSNWCGNDSFEPKIWSGLYQRTLTNFMISELWSGLFQLNFSLYVKRSFSIFIMKKTAVPLLKFTNKEVNYSEHSQRKLFFFSYHMDGSKKNQ